MPRRGQAAAERAALEERLRALEERVAEVQSRLNALVFMVVGAAIVQALVQVAR